MLKKIKFLLWILFAIFQFVMAFLIKSRILSNNIMDILAILQILSGVIIISFALFTPKDKK